MTYQLLYHHLVEEEDLPKIPNNIQKRIRQAIEQRLLREPLLAGKPLQQSLKGHKRMRVGDYRIIYRLEHTKIIILKIGHRKDVYSKSLSRL